MLTLAPFTFCANNVPGTDPIRAMDMARRCGFHTIELSAIDGISEQIVAERVSTGYVAQIERELQKRDLQCTALSAHCDMTDEAQFARLMKKIEFAGQIGARLVNTRCGPKTRYDVFLEHVKRAAELADRYGMRLGLESYGDIVGPASECGGVFAELNLPNVQYTYDPGNTYRFCRGEIRLDEDLQNASVPVAYLHMKDGSHFAVMSDRENVMNWVVGLGTVDENHNVSGLGYSFNRLVDVDEIESVTAEGYTMVFLTPFTGLEDKMPDTKDIDFNYTYTR